MNRIVNIKTGAKYDVYCGRIRKGESGYFGNPHVIGYCSICEKTHDRKDCIAAYKIDFDKRILDDLDFKNKILELKDKTLGCFCVDENGNGECHVNIIKEYLDKIFNKPIKLAVIGSRGFDNRELVYKILDKNINRIEMIVSGGCKNSADELAHDWAKERGKPILIYYPDWNGLGKSAGFARNRKIIESCDKVAAFWDGKSRGTSNSIEIAKELNKPVKIINF